LGARPYIRTGTGEADIGIGRSDDILMLVANARMPLVIVAAEMQIDPQAVLVHADSPVRTLQDLDGRAVMVHPGAAWVPYLKRRYGIEFSMIPLNFGLGTFFADRSFIQQCLATNEPFIAAQRGVPVRVLLLSEAGYRPYRVIYANASFLRRHPEAVRAFIAASLRGWEEFLEGDNVDTLTRIGALSPQLSPEHLEWTVGELRRNRFVTGDPERGDRLGRITRKRMEEQIEQLSELGLLRHPIVLEEAVRLDLLPPGVGEEP
jgi:NitT/TauT family transport system substrate-binding protein